MMSDTDRVESAAGQTAPNPRQTLGYLRNLFHERGIHPKNKLGQNFLIDLNLLDLILRTAELGPDDLVLEVGSGTGSLTLRLADAAGAVLSVEIDPDFASLVQETAAGRHNLTLLHADILKNKNELNPEVLGAISERLPDKCLKLVANLPYVVATPVIANFLLTELPFERLLVTVQWEIAERLMAEPGTKAFGALAVLVQSLADVQLVRRLPPAAFWPKPKVESGIVLIRPDAARRARVGDPRRFRNFLRDLYTHRRKNLRSALAALPNGTWKKRDVDQKLGELGLKGDLRAEQLDVEDHRRLCEMFAPASGEA